MIGERLAAHADDVERLVHELLARRGRLEHVMAGIDLEAVESLGSICWPSIVTFADATAFANATWIVGTFSASAVM